MDHSKKHYYGSRESEGGFYKGIVYHYDQSGNRQVKVWTSEELFDSSEEAQDAAAGWADANYIDAEME